MGLEIDHYASEPSADALVRGSAQGSFQIADESVLEEVPVAALQAYLVVVRDERIHKCTTRLGDRGLVLEAEREHGFDVVPGVDLEGDECLGALDTGNLGDLFGHNAR